MLNSVVLKALVVWFAILPLAIANGVLRESVLVPLIGDWAAFVLSGLLLSALIIGVAYFALPWLAIRRASALFGVGLGWLALTVVFEFSFGFWQGKSLGDLLEAYTFRGGNIWPVVLAVTALAPSLAARLRKRG